MKTGLTDAGYSRLAKIAHKTAAIEIEVTDGGSYDTLQIDSLDEAEEAVKDWILDGEWGEGKAIVHAEWRVADSDDAWEKVSMEVGDDPEEPPCTDEEGHDWQDGDLRGVGGTKIVSDEICSNCGLIKRWHSSSTPGQYPEEPEYVEYIDNEE